MTHGSADDDPRWHRLLSLAGHEFRTPVTVVAGYIRMLLKDRAGPLSDQQRHMLEEAERSTGRLASLAAELSELASLEAGQAKFHRNRVELGPIVEDAIRSLPPLPDRREVALTLKNEAAGAAVEGDRARLNAAVAAVLTALRRELVTSTELLVHLRREANGGVPLLRISIADDERIRAVENAAGGELARFDEWRGGCGLSLAIARRVIAAHNGQLWSPAAAAKAGAVLIIPEA